MPIDHLHRSMFNTLVEGTVELRQLLRHPAVEVHLSTYTPEVLHFLNILMYYIDTASFIDESVGIAKFTQIVGRNQNIDAFHRTITSALNRTTLDDEAVGTCGPQYRFTLAILEILRLMDRYQSAVDVPTELLDEIQVSLPAYVGEIKMAALDMLNPDKMPASMTYGPPILNP